MPEPILVPGLVLNRHEAEVLSSRFRVKKTMGIVDEGCDGHRCADSDLGDASQQKNGWRLVGSAIEFSFNASEFE